MAPWIALAALAMLGPGCTQIFGLERPISSDGAIGSNDRDGDTIPNDADNCPDVANRDQLDTDSDGIGDACDDCLALALRASDDDDGDGYDDTKDTCPGLTGSPADDDNDRIGNACDVRVGVDRACVLTFRPPASTENAGIWPRVMDLGRWTLDSSFLHMAKDASAAVVTVHDDVSVGTSGIAVEARSRLNATSPPVDVSVSAQLGGHLYSCRVAQQLNAAANVEIARDGLTVVGTQVGEPLITPITGVSRLWLDKTSSTITTVHCMVQSDTAGTFNVTTDVSAALPATTRVSIGALGVDVDTFDLVLYRLGA